MHKKKVHYTTVEKFPISEKEVLGLDFGNKHQDQLELQQLHGCEWNTVQQVDEYFSIQKLTTDFKVFTQQQGANLIYFDAFAPTLQPDLWEAHQMERVFQNLRSGGVFVTSCAKGNFRRILKSLGLEVQKLPDPPGKREITRALKVKN